MDNPFFILGFSIDLFIGTLFRGTPTTIHDTSDAPKFRNLLISEQLYRALMPMLFSHEKRILSRLRILAETDRGGSLENYIPLFTTLCILFSLYSHAACQENSLPKDARYPLVILNCKPPKYEVETASVKLAWQREIKKTGAALRSCKELAQLYLAIFQKMGPFAWKTEKEWKPLESWLEGIGYEGLVRWGAGESLRAFVSESSRGWRECPRWRPGLPFHPGYVEEVLRY